MFDIKTLLILIPALPLAATLLTAVLGKRVLRGRSHWPTVAALLLRLTLSSGTPLGVTHPTGSDGQSFLWEIVLTFFLVFVVTAVATDARAVKAAAGFCIGGTVVLDALVGGSISGATMNPARSFGPALVAGDFNGLWIYLAAPIGGGVIAALVYLFLRDEKA